MTEDFGDIVAGVRAGSPDAWAALYRRFYPLLVGYICKHYRAEPEDAEDLASEVLLVVVRQIKRGDLREADALYAYIFSVQHRHVAHWMKRQYLGRHHEPIKKELPIVIDAPSAEDQILWQEQADALAQAAQLLSARDQELFRRVYVLEQTREQIRQELGLTENQFRLNKSRIKIKLFARIHRLRPQTDGQQHNLWELREQLAAR